MPGIDVTSYLLAVSIGEGIHKTLNIHVGGLTAACLLLLMVCLSLGLECTMA